MKVICSIDFSKSSINACKWIHQYLSEIDNSMLELVHCISLRKRSDVFLNLYEILQDRAKEEIEELKQELTLSSDDVTVNYKIVGASPKTYLKQLADSGEYDLIVTGTKGLTALKDMTVGSVTDYLMSHSTTPILTIPQKAKFDGVKKIVLGIEDDQIAADSLKILKRTIDVFDSKVFVTHVRNKKSIMDEINGQEWIRVLGQKRATFRSLEQDDSVAETLEEFADDIDSDLICLVHKRRKWFSRLFHRSVVKSELFEIETPLLILNTGD